MSVVQPGNLIKFKDSVWAGAGPRGRGALVLCDANINDDGISAVAAYLNPADVAEAIFLFIKAEAYENNQTKIWVLYDEKLWYTVLIALPPQLWDTHVVKL